MKNKVLLLTIMGLGFSAIILAGLPKVKSKKVAMTVPDPATCVLESLEGAGIGDVKQSVLSETDFQNVNGAEWVLLNGAAFNILGYGTYDTNNGTIESVRTQDINIYYSLTNLPDGRGVFLRGKNNSRNDGYGNPGGDFQLGDFQEDAFQGHHHMFFAGGGMTPGPSGPGLNGGNSNSPGYVHDPISDGINGTPRAKFETRPRNIAVNTFVKIRRKCVDISIQQQIDVIKGCRPLDTVTYPTDCLDMIEVTEQDKHDKVACFKAGLGEWEAASSVAKYWTKTCLVQTVANAKRILIGLGGSRTTPESDWYTYIVEEFPYYNTVQTAKQ